jgi:gamma-glutamylcyclotransferase (GGCT)/AIG2-like uncharacterized protein YtfP
MIYFAYGSNLDRQQMAQRCPNAKVIGPAQLTDHRICFPRKSPVRGCAVASIEPHAGMTVWGLMYEMTADDLKRLDAREGYDPVNLKAANRYDRVEIVIEQMRGEPVKAVTYVALPEDEPGLPSFDYMKQIIDGAVANSFPDDYVASLKAFPVDAGY